MVKVRILPMDTFDTLRPQMLDTVDILSVDCLKDRSPNLGLLGTVVMVLLLATIEVLE